MQTYTHTNEYKCFNRDVSSQEHNTTAYRFYLCRWLGLGFVYIFSTWSLKLCHKTREIKSKANVSNSNIKLGRTFEQHDHIARTHIKLLVFFFSFVLALQCNAFIYFGWFFEKVFRLKLRFQWNKIPKNAVNEWLFVFDWLSSKMLHISLKFHVFLFCLFCCVDFSYQPQNFRTGLWNF